MADINQVGNDLTGSTGTGAFVGATSPTLVTPTLGVAAATNINFGGTSLGNYGVSTFTPTFTTNVVGDLSVSYGTASGFYRRIGRTMTINYSMVFTPTFTTASGTLKLAGLPSAVNATTSVSPLMSASIDNLLIPGTNTMVYAKGNGGNSFLNVVALGSNSGPQNLTVANSGLTSGVAYTVKIGGFYFV